MDSCGKLWVVVGSFRQIQEVPEIVTISEQFWKFIGNSRKITAALRSSGKFRAVLRHSEQF